MFHHEVHYKSATIDCNRVFSLRNGRWKFFFIYFHLGSRASLGYTTLPFFLSPFLSTFFCSTFNSSFLPSLLSFPYTWKSALLGENPQKLSPTFLLGIHRKLYLSNIIYQHLFDLLWQKIQKRINISHRYVYLKQVGYIQQLEHCKLTILQHNTGILKRREEKQCLLYSPWPPWLAFATPSLELTAGLGWVWDSLAGCPSLNLF